VAITYAEEFDKIRGERENALSSRRSTFYTEDDAELEKADMERILFGDGTNYGVLHLSYAVYRQIYVLSGRSTTMPVFNDFAVARGMYEDVFKLCVTTGGDGDGGLYPPISSGSTIGGMTFNKGSKWIVGHNLGTTATGTGILQKCQPVVDAVGTAAIRNADKRGPYTTQSAANSAMAADRGTGFLGRRTDNSEVYSITDTTTNVTEWWIGKDGLDDPDDFEQSTTFFTALLSLHASMADAVAIVNLENDLVTNTNNAILEEFKIAFPEDSGLEDMLADVTELAEKVAEWVTYFGAFTDPTPVDQRDEINAKLADVNSLITPIITRMTARMTELPDLLGDAETGSNKYLAFWIEKLVSKLDGGPYSVLNGIPSMLTSAEDQIKAVDKEVKIFSEDLTEYLTTPTFTFNSAIDLYSLENEYIRSTLDVNWKMNLGANKYKFFVKPLSAITFPIDNSVPWGDEDMVWIVDSYPDDYTILLNKYRIDPAPTEPIIYRVMSFDTDEGPTGGFDRQDTFNTSSRQSDLISDEIPFTQLADIADKGSVIQVGSEEGLTANSCLCINGSSDLVSIANISEDKYLLKAFIGTITSVRIMKSVYLPRDRI
jgi:hypothetical protein